MNTKKILWASLGLWLTATLIVSAIAFNTRRTPPYSPITEAPHILRPTPAPLPTPTSIVLRPNPTPTPPNYFEQFHTGPANGEIKVFRPHVNRIADLTIKTASGCNYLVRLYDASTELAVLSVFVRGGETVTVKVPLGTFTVKFASGIKWQDYWNLFGEWTTYTKANTVLNFRRTDQWISTYSLTLYTVPGGNIQLSQIPANEF
jgi:hypothetical protein